MYEEALKDIDLLQEDKQIYLNEIQNRDIIIREKEAMIQEKDTDLGQLASIIKKSTEIVESMMTRLGVP